MSMGAVMYRTGKINGTALGGLYRTMPLTCIFCMVGAASISAFPLFSGFVSKSMVMDAAAGGHMTGIWFLLLFASAGVFHHAGIKIPFFAFFGHDSGMRPKEAPLNMLLAMGIAAFLCIFIGSFPGPLYSLLPYPVDYVPYTMPHVVGQTQLLFFSALAFSLLLLSGIYPGEQRCINVDSDWFYRKGARLFYYIMDRGLNGVNAISDRAIARAIPAWLGPLSRTPVTTLVTAYMRATGKGRVAIENFRKETSPEATNLMPTGVPVLISIVFLFSLFVLFVFLT
jgi:multicomponent Na+:H+ antiporter subunit D